jgi:hypothetical protein
MSADYAAGVLQFSCPKRMLALGCRLEGIMPETSTSPLPDQQFAQGSAKRTSPLKLAFRIVRWTTYAGALLMLALVLHKAPAPAVETSPQAAARAEEKFQDVANSVKSGQPATLRLDETELNSYLVSHLDLAGGPGLADASGTVTVPMPGNSAENRTGATTSKDEVEQMRSNVKDVKVELVEDRVRAYVVFDVHGKDLSLQLEGRLGVQDGFLKFEPVSGQIGAMPLPQSALESAVQRMMESPENREKLRLPADISDLRIENGEVVVGYK